MKKLLLFLFCFIVFCTFKAECQLTTNLEEYYKLDETSGAPAMNSVGGTNNSSIPVSATQGASSKSGLGTCYSFNGSSNKVNFPENTNWVLATTTSLSISAWINFSAHLADGKYGNIFGTNDRYAFQVKNVGGSNYILLWWAGGTNYVSSATFSVTIGTWYHVVMTKSGSSEVRLYINNGTPTVGTPVDANSPITQNFIGGDMGDEYFNGKIDEVGIWKRVLSSAEVSQLYNSGNGLPYSSFAGSVPVTSVTLAPASASLAAGNSTQLTATVLPSNATNQSVSWGSNNPPVASVSSSGLVTGNTVGTAIITVYTVDGGKMASCTVTVGSPVLVTGVTLSPATITINAGTTTQLTASVLPANATNKTVNSFTTSNSAVATVNSSGLVTGIAGGTAIITATSADQGKTATSTITVNPAPTNISLNNTWISNDGGNEGIRVDNSGNVGIGTGIPNTAYKLDVLGKIRAQEILVNLNAPAADYVFKPEYNLMPLKEVDQYVKLNSHLPGIPSASAIEQDGLSIGEMQNKLLQKIEELTLYIIKQDKEIYDQGNVLKTQREAIERLEMEISILKNK